MRKANNTVNLKSYRSKAGKISERSRLGVCICVYMYIYTEICARGIIGKGGDCGELDGPSAI